MGYLNIIMGPMYSGKSTELIRIYNKYKLKKKVLVINHKSDNRYGENSVNTHNKNNLNCISFDKLTDYYTKFPNNCEDKPDIIPNNMKFFLIKNFLFKSLNKHKINE